MPILSRSSYTPVWPYGNAHAATSLPTLLRRVPPPPGDRVRIDTPDGDFIDPDHWFDASGPTVLLCHGLEGNAQRQYMRGMGWAFGRRGYRVVAYNYRGCSGEPNRTLRTYHSGATDDLRRVLDHVRGEPKGPVALVGFSLGANLILKYLGEAPADVHPGVAAAVAISALHPGAVDLAPLARLRTLRDFDDLYTAPMHGFADAADYYRRCSAAQVLPAITVPTLILSARNDPFLGPSCFPVEAARDSAAVHLEAPDRGGHVGFHRPGREYWSEARAAGFVEGVIGDGLSGS